MNETKLLDRALPKWPQMIVTGTSVSEEQAMEIIRRTDTFIRYRFGNNHEFVEAAKKVLRLPEIPESNGPAQGRDIEAWHAAWEDYEKKEAEYMEKWQYIETEYVKNSWISSTFIGGPHGWCHPDGTIKWTDNIGKWPEVKEVYNEWKVIAEAFPYLELEVSLMDGESCEYRNRPVISFLIREWKVNIVDPEERDLHKEFGRDSSHEEPSIFAIIDRINNNYENAIPLETLELWAKKVFDVSE